MKTNEELEKEMYELRGQRIFLSSQLSFEMEGYWNNNPLSIDNMNEIRQEIIGIDQRLIPLQQEYEARFHHYHVCFSSEMPYVGGGISKSAHNVCLRSEINYDIDTTRQRIDLVNDKNAYALFLDLSQTLMQTYMNFKFEMIKKVN